MKIYGIITIDLNNKIINNQISLNGLSNGYIRDHLSKRKGDEKCLFITNILETSKYIWSLKKGVKTKKDYLNVLSCNSNSSYYTFDIMYNMNNLELDTGKKPKKRTRTRIGKRKGKLIKYDAIKEQLLTIPLDVITDYILIHHIIKYSGQTEEERDEEGEIREIRRYSLPNLIKIIYGYFGENYKIFLIFKSVKLKVGIYNDIYKLLYNSHNLIQYFNIDPVEKTNRFTFKCFENLRSCQLLNFQISSHMPYKLKYLSLHNCTIDDIAFENLSGLVSLKLNGCIINETSFKYLNNLNRLTLNATFGNLTNKIFIYCSKLSRLKLKEWDAFNIDFLKGVENIRFIQFHNIEPVSNKDFLKLKFKELDTLRIYGLDEITDEAFANFANLRKLEINKCNKLTGDFLKHHEQFQKINACVIKKCDEIIDIIINKMPNVEEMYFEKCANIEFSTFKRGKNIKKLTFIKCEEITGKFPYVLPNVISAKFEKCDILSDKIFEYIPNVIKLKIVDCDNMEGDGFSLWSKNLIELSKKFLIKPKLELKISELSYETNDNLLYNIGYLGNLNHLNWYNGDLKLVPEKFKFLYYLKNLETLYLSIYLIDKNNYLFKLINLKRLYIGDIEKFTEEFGLELKNFIVNLEVVYIGISFITPKNKPPINIDYLKNLKDIVHSTAVFQFDNKSRHYFSNKKSLFIGNIKKLFNFK